jgi:hypothetical protein
VAERFEKFTTVAAAGVTNSFVDHTFLDGQVTRVALYVPDGHAGLTEWSFWYGASQLIPQTPGSVIVANDQQFDWTPDNMPTGSGWRSRVTNTDVYAHRFHVQVWLDPLGVAGDEQTYPVLILPVTPE